MFSIVLEVCGWRKGKTKPVYAYIYHQTFIPFYTIQVQNHDIR
jgi:hypothetical protein